MRMTRGAPPLTPAQLRLLELVSETLAGAPEDCLRFFHTAIALPLGESCKVTRVAYHCAVNPSTVQNRFLRAQLPRAKHLLDRLWLVRIAEMLRAPDRPSLRSVANAADLSSANHLNRKVRLLTGRTGAEWRRTASVEARLEEFRALLVEHQATLVRFSPLVSASRATSFSTQAAA